MTKGEKSVDRDISHGKWGTGKKMRKQRENKKEKENLYKYIKNWHQKEVDLFFVKSKENSKWVKVALAHLFVST